MRRRRFVMSLVLLLATLTSLVEPVVGQARDDEVHHRGVSGHVDQPTASDAGHDAPAPRDRSGQSSDTRHEHGTHVDHCTHQHSAPLVTALSFALPVQQTDLPLLEPTLHFGRFPGGLFRPPRA